MSSTTLRELERQLLHETGTRLERFGFAIRPKGQSFLKPLDGGRVAAHLTFIEHEHDFDVTADVAIRFDAVEDLVNASNALISEKEKSMTFTLGAELGNLEHGRPCRFEVAGHEGIEAAAERIVNKFEQVGLPYIDRFSRPEAAYDVLSRDDRAVWVHSPIHAERAKRACALLKVLDRTPEVRDLGAKKLSFLASLGDPGAPAFSRFLAELTSKP